MPLRDRTTLREAGLEIPGELDVVSLREKVNGWPTGTEATVVHAYDEAGLLEVTDDDGETLDVVMADYAQLNIVWRANRQLLH